MYTLIIDSPLHTQLFVVSHIKHTLLNKHTHNTRTWRIGNRPGTCGYKRGVARPTIGPIWPPN